MKKISELSGESFFDVVYALSPILPLISETEVVQAHLFDNFNDKIKNARATIALNTTLTEKGGSPDKKSEYEEKIKEARQVINSEISGIFARDITKIVPLLASRANRGCIFETLSILENKSIDEIKQYPPPKLISRIAQVVKDVDFKSFLSYAEESDATE